MQKFLIKYVKDLMCPACCLLVINCFLFISKNQKMPLCHFGHQPDGIMLSLCLVWFGEWEPPGLTFLCVCQIQHCSEPPQYPNSRYPRTPHPLWWFSLHTQFIINYFSLL